MSIQSEDSLSRAYKFIETCSVKEAVDILNEALPADLGNEDLVFAIQCCNFWKEVFVGLNSMEKNSWFEKGEVILNSWNVFLKMQDCSDNSAKFGAKSAKNKKNSQDDNKLEFYKEDEGKNLNYVERTLYAFKKGIFSLALDFYSREKEQGDAKFTAELCRKKGLCYKKLGSYEEALKLLKEANSKVEGLSYIMAETADCYALCGETKFAKLIFREAYFVNPQKIDLSYLDSPLIGELEDKVKEKGYSGAALLEWMAVWGVLYKTFNVKRKLRSQEVFQLQQDIFAKESELKDPTSNRGLLVPRLINLYFWLVDYYLLSKEKLSKVSEVLLKIKLLDPVIYSIYVGER